MEVTDKDAHNVSFVCELLYQTTRICSQRIDKNAGLISCNAAYPEAVNTFFRMNCPLNIAELIDSGNTTPKQYTDGLLFSWIIFPLPEQKEMLVIGPTLAAAFSRSYLSRQPLYQNLSVKEHMDLDISFVNTPVISAFQFAQYGNMVYYALYHSLSDISEWLANCGRKQTPDEFFHDMKTDVDRKIMDTLPASHGSRTLELRMLENVRNGLIGATILGENESVPIVVGDLCPGDPLRQSKNGTIIKVTLMTRAAVEGGVEAETAYSLSDYFIQKTEQCANRNDAFRVGIEAYDVFVQAVYNQKHRYYSDVVNYMISYINKHVNENIDLNVVAQKAGYDTYYLTHKFRSETGLTVKEYILKRKIDHAKVLLTTTALPINEICAALSFSSPAYFSAQFRKIMNMTPEQYRNRSANDAIKD